MKVWDLDIPTLVKAGAIVFTGGGIFFTDSQFGENGVLQTDRLKAESELVYQVVGVSVGSKPMTPEYLDMMADTCGSLGDGNVHSISHRECLEARTEAWEEMTGSKQYFIVDRTTGTYTPIGTQ